MTVAPPSPPMIGPAKFHGGANNKPIHRVVIHCTVSPCQPGNARSVANYFKSAVTRPSSAHYVVDPAEIVQCVGDSTVAYHAPPNTNSIGVELSDMQAGAITRWQDANHKAMLALAAPLVARLCLAYDVPITRLSVADLKAKKHGICGHVDVSNAFHETTHTDPGNGFPWDAFMKQVKEAAMEIQSGRKPTPKPAADPYPRITQARALLVAAGKKAGPKRKALIDTAIAAVDAINGGK